VFTPEERISVKNRIKNKTAAALAAALTAAGLALAIAPAQPAHASTVCGGFRWPVKTGTDATRFKVSRTISYTSVGYLDHLVPPASFGSYAWNHRIKWPEFRTWQLKATLVAVKVEHDGDIHLRLRNSGHLMIGEIPKPSCVSYASLWKAAITSARQAVTSRYWVSQSSWHYIYRTVSVRGLGFFDDETGTTGAAPNNIELHPVIHIRFL
jgi:hypothetical protein